VLARSLGPGTRFHGKDQELIAEAILDHSRWLLVNHPLCGRSFADSDMPGVFAELGAPLLHLISSPGAQIGTFIAKRQNG